MPCPRLLRTKKVSRADVAIETAVTTLLAADNAMDRIAALRLLTQRMVKKNVTNRTRVRTAATT